MEERAQLEIGEEPSDFFAQISSLLQYKYQIAGIALIAILITAVVVFNQQPVYRATSSIYIEPRQQNVLNMQEVYDSGAGTQSHYATQVTVLASRDLATKAVGRIDWSQYPDFLPMQDEADQSWLAGLVERYPVINRYLPFVGSLVAAPEVPLEAMTEEERLRQLTSAFMRSTRVVPLFATQIVNIQFLSENPKLAMEGANALASVYIDSGLEAQFEATRRATDWMNERLQDVRGSLAASESELQQFREAEQLVNIRGGRGVLEDELTDNMQRLRDAQRQMTQLQNTYESIQRAGYNTYALQQTPLLLDKELVRATKKSYLAAQESLSELQSRYGPRHPRIINAQARLEEARAAFDAQLRNAAEGVRSDYQIAAQNVRSLTATVEKTRAEIVRLDRQDYQMQVLRRDADANSELYDTILARFKTADLAGDFEALKARVVDPAILPDRPYLPRKKRALIFAAFFGLLGGIILALIRSYLDNAIKTGDELERLSYAPVFASVPAVGGRLFRKSLPKLISSKPHTPFAEAVRTIRTGIVLSDLDKKRKRLLITSAVPQEGKSSLACNLAQALGEVEKVLLIDCDLRKPNLARYLDVKKHNQQFGLSELLQGQVRKNQAIHQIADNVDLLPIGKLPSVPGEILTSKRFGDLLEELSADYDRVILDSAPCQPVSDTLLLAKHVDGIVFVVLYDSTPVKTVRATLKRLRQVKAPILGMVLNKVDHKKAVKSGDTYYYGHGYYG